MLNPDFDSLLWIVYILFIIEAVGHIILGLAGAEKETHYGVSNVIYGIIMLLVLLYITLK